MSLATKKRGMFTLQLAFELLAAAIIVVMLLNLARDWGTGDIVLREIAIEDLALGIDAIYASPGEIKATYPLPAFSNTFNITFEEEFISSKSRFLRDIREEFVPGVEQVQKTDINIYPEKERAIRIFKKAGFISVGPYVPSYEQLVFQVDTYDQDLRDNRILIFSDDYEVASEIDNKLSSGEEFRSNRGVVEGKDLDFEEGTESDLSFILLESGKNRIYYDNYKPMFIEKNFKLAKIMQALLSKSGKGHEVKKINDYDNSDLEEDAKELLEKINSPSIILESDAFTEEQLAEIITNTITKYYLDDDLKDIYSLKRSPSKIKQLMGRSTQDMISLHSSLISKEAKQEDIQLNRITLRAFENMYKKAKSENLELKLARGFTSYDEQKREWLDGERKTLPGTSRYSWGTEISIISEENTFFKSEEGKKILSWMQENAEDYGFCNPYADKPWQWSYQNIADQREKEYLSLMREDDFVDDELRQKTGTNIKESMSGVIAEGNCVNE